MGRLTADPTLYQKGEGKAARFSIATHRAAKDEDGNWTEVPNFFDCVLFGRQAENFCTHLGKGSPVLIEGELVQEKKTTQDGREYNKIEIHVRNFVFPPTSNKDKVEETENGQ